MRRLLLAVALAAIVAVPARADLVGAIGPIVALRIQNTSSDDFASFKGFILVGESIGGYVRYNWGGSRCPALILTDAEIQSLQRGMNNPRILIEPSYKLGQGPNLCLVAWSLVLRSDQAALP